MEEFSDFIRIYHSNLIRGMFFSVLTVLFLQKFFPDIVSKSTYPILRWIIITCALSGITSYLLQYDGTVLSEPATGPYWWSYWLMTICAFGLPFLLLYKNLKHKKWPLLIIAILVNAGWLLELFVITMTSLHRDYAPEGFSAFSFPTVFIVITIQGIFIGLFVVLIENIVRRYRKKHTFANLKT
ncbi:MAG: hypothetical protein ACO1N9_06190 [Flavobacterium sp.]